MNAFTKALALVGVAVLFLLAVAASTQGLTVGLPQSVLLLVLALCGVRYFRDDREGLIKSALIALGAGVLIRLWSNPLAGVLSDSLIALAITVAAVYLIGPPLVRFFRHFHAGFSAARTTLSWPVPRVAASPGGRRDLTATLSAWQPFAVAAVLCILLVIPGAGRFIGFESASLQWNTHILTTNVLREGAHLADPSVVLAGSASTFVAIPDSLLLSALKLIDPSAWAAFAGNLITLASVGVFFAGAALFLQRLSFGWTESIAATTLFLLLPLGLELRFAAPLDLSIALIAVLPALSGNLRPAPFLAAAFATGLCNTANGYEYAALIIALRAFNLTRAQISNRIYGAAAALGVAGSIIASFLLKGLAPAASLRETWWYTHEISRIIWAERLPVFWLAIVIFAILAIAGLRALRQARLFALFGFTAALVVGAGILAIPTQLGGIPLVSLADFLQLIAPQGWPTARFLELATFALAVPVAYAMTLLLDSVRGRRRFVRAAVVWVAALILFVLCVPRSQKTVLPAAAADAATVEFPIAEAGSRAGVLYAEDLLAARARVLQPLIFVDKESPLDLRSTPADAPTVKAMRDAGVRFVILRSDIYAKPDWRTVEPRLYSPAFSAITPLDAGYPWKIITYTPAGQGG